MGKTVKENSIDYMYLFENSAAVMLIIDPEDGSIFDANPSACHFYGWSRAEITSKTMFDIDTLPARDLRIEITRLSTEKKKHFHFIHRIAGGSLKHVKASTGLIKIDDKDYYFAVISDITDYIKAKEELQENVNKIQSIFRAAPIGIGVVADRILKDVNNYFCKMVGYTREELLEKDGSQLYLEDTEYESAGRVNCEQLSSGITGTLETKFRKKNGEIIDVLLSSSPIDTNDLSLGVTFAALDITHSKRSGEKIRSLGSLADLAPANIIIVDNMGNILYANEQCFRTYGYSKEEFMKINIWDLEKEKNIENHSVRVREYIETGNASFEITHICKDGSEKSLQVYARAIRWEGKDAMLSVSTDLTQAKRTEEYLSRTQRLDSLGVLAGGIAHDFNNLLGIIFGYIDLALASCSKNSEIAGYLEKSINGLNRSRDLTQQLLTFSRGGSPVKKTASLVPLLKEAVKFSLSGSNIESIFNIDEDLWLCDFDENQISQVIDNLTINAQQAMPSGGVITITAKNVELKDDDNPGLSEGNYVKISFVDTGAGIPSKIIQSIFDPFFTTKEKGNGLGLTTAYSIIKKHGGDISVNSGQAKGTAFHILIPASSNQVTAPFTDDTTSHHGSGRVLVMDDEVLMLDITRIMLTEMGYEVVTVLDGARAIEAFTDSFTENNQFKAVILDLTVRGGIGGKEAIREIRNIDKNVKVIASSGYSDDPVISNPAEYDFTDSIKKPYNKNQIMALFNRLFPSNTYV
ncbi:MAG: PAS domain S-box protein [Spirochaetes bacterium]|nr:PAS domain S-box protein [Spirochaetota bacterium]